MASMKHIEGILVNDKGTWTVRARFADSVDSKVRLHSKSTGLKVKAGNKRKAEAAMRDILAEWENAYAFPRCCENPLFKDCLMQWLEKKQLSVSPSTLESYKVMSHAHIIPKLGDIGIRDLKRQDLRQYFEYLKNGGKTASTMKKHRVIIRGVLQDAVLDDLIQTNVADNLSLHKGNKFESRVLNESQFLYMLNEIEHQSEPLRAAIILASVYGLRRSEICGLRWDDIDFGGNIIHIRNTVTEYSGTVYEAETTKTRASRRDLHLIPNTSDYFKALKQSQQSAGIFNGKVCVRSDGIPVKPSYITRICENHLRASGFDGMRLHDLRHTVATVLAKRVPIKQVQSYLGHEDIQTTLNIYTHVLSEDIVATSMTMDKFLSSSHVPESDHVSITEICSEKCSESHAASVDNIILFPAIADKNVLNV